MSITPGYKTDLGLSDDQLGADPHLVGGRRVIFMSGDDAKAKAVVGRVIEKAGFAPIDLGDLVAGGRMQQFPGGPLPTLNLIKLP